MKLQGIFSQHSQVRFDRWYLWNHSSWELASDA